MAGGQGHIRAWGAALLLPLAMPNAALATSVEDAVRKGITLSPDVRAAQAEEAAADTDVSIAKGGYYPGVSISGGPQSLNFDGLGYDVTASQMLYDWGRVSSGVGSARAAQRKLNQQMLVKRDEVALDVVETYLDIIVTERQIAALGEHIARLDQIREMTVARAETGYASRSEPERANLELARAREQLAVEQGTLDNARNQYRVLVGEEPQDLSEPNPASVSAYVARGDLDSIIRDSPVARAASEDTRAAEAKLKEARASLYPQVNIEASTLRRDVGGIAREDTIVALRFRTTTFQGLSNFLRPRGAAQRVQSAQLAEAVVERDSRRQVQTLFDNAAMSKQREELLATQVSTSDDVGATYLDQFRAGQRDVIDLLNAQRERYDAERQLINVHIDRLRVEYRAAARLGLIGPLLEKGLI